MAKIKLYTVALKYMEYYKFNNGVKMPKVGLGTFLISDDKLSQTIGLADMAG